MVPSKLRQASCPRNICRAGSGRVGHTSAAALSLAIVGLLAALLTVSACTNVVGDALGAAIDRAFERHIPAAVEPGTGGLGISLQVCPPLALVCANPDQLVFVSLDDPQALGHPRLLVLSDWLTGGRGYLLNVPPGTYAVVAALEYPQGFEESVERAVSGPEPSDMGVKITYLPRALVAQTVTQVQPGVVRFMGAYRVKQRLLEQPDPVQSAYYARLEQSGAVYWIEIEPYSGTLLWLLTGKPTAVIPGGTGLAHTVARLVFTLHLSYQGTGYQARDTAHNEAAFWRNALGDLGNSAWTRRVRARLADLPAP